MSTSGGTSGGGGTISEITSSGDTVTITDPTGPTTNLEVAGGGGGFPYQSFTGSPVGVVTPTAAGYLGLATDTFALYYASAATSADWVQVSGPLDLTAPGFSAAVSSGVEVQLTAAVFEFLVDDSTGNTLMYIVDTSAGGGIQLTDKGGGGISLTESVTGTIALSANEGGDIQLLGDGVTPADILVGQSTDIISFFDQGGALTLAVTGALSSVIDPNVQAILTSILAALSPAVGYGLVNDSTT